ncbi:MAG TPA: hypothetical protein VMZ06_10330 [Candidatus Bathyarchaeia archaeon]|nr:hypothetical protein [Candidatus Bathyarchaeia archaeon]
MALIDLWKTNKAELDEKKLQQIIAISGDGRLTNDSTASREFRDFLRIVPSEKLSEYAQQCLGNHFDQSGLALQDIVNEIGRRLGFVVTEGLYRGKRGVSGHDGLWTLKNGRKIVIEVKTTDAYAIDLDTIAEYRRILARDGLITLEETSLLLIVGRKDTGGLEAQIRGSQYAWDMRLISIDALIRLMKVKETLEDPKTVSQISDILVPKEFTKVDGIIDLVFITAEEVATADEATPESEDALLHPEPLAHPKKFIPVNFHKKCVERIQQFLGSPLVKESRTSYTAPDTNLRVVVAVSKAHGTSKARAFWFAFHPHQRDFLKQSPEAKLALGCGSENVIFLIPFSVLEPHLNDTWTTQREDRMYWHIHIELRHNKYYWTLRKGIQKLLIDDYLLPVSKSSQ